MNKDFSCKLYHNKKCVLCENKYLKNEWCYDVDQKISNCYSYD